MERFKIESAGFHTIRARVANKLTSLTGSLTIEVDTVGPTATPHINDDTGYDSQIDWLYFTFSEAVQSSTCSFTLSKYNGSTWEDYSFRATPTFFYDSGTNTAKWDLYDNSTYAPVIADNGWYIAVVHAHDMAGNDVHIDANHTNYVKFLRLTGDFDQDRNVAFDDYQILEGNFGKSGLGLWAPGDATLDGQVTFPDYQLMEGSFGQNFTAEPTYP